MERLELVETSDQDPLGYARWFALLWGLCATILLSAAWAKTKELTSPRTSSPKPYIVGVYGDYRYVSPFERDAPTDHGTIEYEEGPSGRKWLIDYPGGTQFVVLPRPSTKSTIHCDHTYIGDFTINAGHVDGASVFVLELAEVSVPIFLSPEARSLNPRELHPTFLPGTISCAISDALQQEESYAGRELRVRFADHHDLHVRPLKGSLWSKSEFRQVAELRVAVAIEHAQNMQIYGGIASSQSTTSLRSDQTATIKYEDVRLMNQRDTGFVIVGALIALGAAMLLEALRPFIEWFAATMRRSTRNKTTSRQSKVAVDAQLQAVVALPTESAAPNDRSSEDWPIGGGL